MPNAPLSPRVEQVVAWQFPRERAPQVLVSLRELMEKLQAQARRSSDDFERILLADLKLAAGDEATLRAGLRQSSIDWRDTLVAAGFAHDIAAHHRWFDELRARRISP